MLRRTAHISRVKLLAIDQGTLNLRTVKKIPYIYGKNSGSILPEQVP